MISHPLFDLAPDIFKAAQTLSETIAQTELSKHYVHLLKIRASQINGCAFCINMHTREARKAGISEWKIYLLSAWRESTVFDQRERVVLAWTEALTQVSERSVPRDLYSDLTKQFSELEIVALSASIAMINYWNRMTIGLGIVHPAERESA